MLSATLGILGPVAAAILHQVGSLLVLLNSMRLLVFGDWAELPPVRGDCGGSGAWIGRLDDRVDLAGLGDGPGAVAGPRSSRACGIAPGAATPRAAGPRSGRAKSASCGGSAGTRRARAGLAPPLALSDRAGRDSRPTGVRSLEIGFRTPSQPRRRMAGAGRPATAGAGGDPIEDEGLLLTGDGRYVELAATLQYTIDRSDPGALERFVFDVADGEAALRPLAESAVREVVARRELLDLLTAGRREAEDAAASLLRSGWRPIDSASRSAASRSRTSIRRWRSSTPIATSRAPSAIASAGSTRRTPTATGS